MRTVVGWAKVDTGDRKRVTADLGTACRSHCLERAEDFVDRRLQRRCSDAGPGSHIGNDRRTERRHRIGIGLAERRIGAASGCDEAQVEMRFGRQVADDGHDLQPPGDALLRDPVH